jgi:hypothetical protein
VLFLGSSGAISASCIVRMFVMRDVHLRNLDLNLIYPLDPLLEDCQVTPATHQ